MKLRNIVLVLLLVLAMVALVACGKKGEEQSSEENTTEATTAAKTYTVSFADGIDLDPITVKEGETADEPDYAIAGYTFKWTLDGEEFSFDTPITADIELDVAKTAIEYTVTCGDAEPIKYTIETETFTLAAPTTIPAGKEFDGWYDGDTKVTSIVKGTTGNIVLVAHYNSLPLVSYDMSNWNSTTDGDIAIHYAETNTIRGFDYEKDPEASDGYVVPFAKKMSGYGEYILCEFFKNSHNFHYIVHEDGMDIFRVELDSTKTTYVKTNGDSEQYNVGVMWNWKQAITNDKFALSFDFRYGEGAMFDVSFYLRDFLDKKAAANGGGNRLNLATLTKDGKIDIGVDAAGNTKRLCYKNGDAFIATSTVLAENVAPAVWHTMVFEFETEPTNTTIYYVTIKLDGKVISGDEQLLLYVNDLTFASNAANCFMPFGGGGAGTTLINDSIAAGTIESFKCNYDFANIKIIAIEDAE